MDGRFFSLGKHRNTHAFKKEGCVCEREEGGGVQILEQTALSEYLQQPNAATLEARKTRIRRFGSRHDHSVKVVIYRAKFQR